MEKSIETLELKISKFLRGGVIVSALIMLIGWLSQPMGDNPFLQFQEYHPLSLELALKNHLHQQHWGMLICYLGLGVLISLPMIRVFLTAILFIRQKERMLAFISFLVLVSLILSFNLGIL